MHLLSNYVIWITGLSGAGKTTLAIQLQQDLKASGHCPILLDGDALREALVNENTYSIQARKDLAFRYAKLAKLLSDQGFIVIVATISMFEDVRLWNRSNNKKYLEVYLKIPHVVRQGRDPKKLYANKADMVEFEKGFEEPQNPDLVFDTHQALDSKTMLFSIKKALKITRAC